MITRDMSPEERLQYCQQVVQAQQDSGLSVSAYCEANKLPRARFYRYRAVVLGKDREQKSEGGVYQVPDLCAQPEQKRTVTLTVGDVRVEFSGELDVETVSSVLRALR